MALSLINSSTAERFPNTMFMTMKKNTPTLQERIKGFKIICRIWNVEQNHTHVSRLQKHEKQQATAMVSLHKEVLKFK